MNIHNLILPAVCAAGLAAPAENLIYAPSGTSKDAKFGIYGSSASGAQTVRDDLFAGAGVLRVGGSLATTLLVR